MGALRWSCVCSKYRFQFSGWYSVLHLRDPSPAAPVHVGMYQRERVCVAITGLPVALGLDIHRR